MKRLLSAKERSSPPPPLAVVASNRNGSEKPSWMMGRSDPALAVSVVMTEMPSS
jgi:hypothetical protein